MEHAGGDGDFFVGHGGGDEGVGVEPLFADLNPFEVVAFEVAVGSGEVTGEVEADGGGEVGEVGDGFIYQFTPFAAHEQALGTDEG